MRLAWSLGLLLAAFLGAPRASAMFKWHETEDVPIDRVLTNLEQRLVREPNSFELTYYLARLHSMAFSTNSNSVRISKDTAYPQFQFPGSDTGVPESVQTFSSDQSRRLARAHLTNAIALYEKAIVLLKNSTNGQDKTWMVVQTQLGLAWCLDQASRTNQAVAMYRKTLKVAWHLEVMGDFNFKAWVTGMWDDVRSGKNPIHERTRGYLGPGVCYSEEIIGYLLRLLDPVRDATEIAELKKEQTTLAGIGRAITPLLVPLLDAAFSDLVDPEAGVAFDLDGSGILRRWGWLTPKAGWLVFDPKKTGRVTSALQMFGNVTFWVFWPDGYQALSALDDNGDGTLAGAELDGLAIWRDENSNGISDPGEVRPLTTFGIVSLSCASESTLSGMRWSARGVTFTNGNSRPTYDWIVPSAAPAFPDR